MQAELWKQIEDLYHAALSRPPEQRADFVQQASFGNPELLAEVESLLRAAAEQSSFLEGAPISYDPSETSAGAVIGAYHLLQRIGEGGMGEVWLAEQKQPVRRRVALKLIKAGMDTREVVSRFESERQALALMDHPAIAKVFDAGSTPSGRPYFVMEYVPGSPITAYCDEHKLTVPERLQLFIRVCEGVKHAHQKAIIHRDLKPSNILVAEVDGEPLPRIIDFGVAKAISQRLTENTLVTHVGALLGTPEYMSPEQVDSGEDIDTRADVYSLGVILYELLVGAVPLDLRKLTLDEMVRKLRVEDAPRPSTKLRAFGKQSATVAQNRRTEPKALLRQLHGDLDSIVLKALEKDRARRYGGPSELATDIERHLRHEPVTARPAGTGYRAWKYVRRHRVGVAFAAAFALLLVAGVVVSSWMAVRASRAEQEALAVNDFLRNDLLEQASVDAQGRANVKKPDPNLKVRTALDRAAARIGGKFGKQPRVEASIRQTIGITYLDLGLYPQAQQQFERILDIHKRNLGEEDSDTLRSKGNLGLLYLREGKYKDAEKLMIETVPALRRVLGKEDRDTLRAEQNLAGLYKQEGKNAEAEALDRELLTILRRRSGKDHPDTLQIENNLAAAYLDQGEYAQAEPILKELLNAMLRVHGPENRNTLAVALNLGFLYDGEGKFAQAETFYARAASGLERLEGKEDYLTLQAEEDLAAAFYHQGNYAQSDARFSEVLATGKRVLGKDHPLNLVAMTDLAQSYYRRGMYKPAEALLVEVLQGRRRKLGAANPDTLSTMGDLGWLYVVEGRYTEAEPLVQEAANQFEKAASDDWELYRVMCAQGAILAGQKQYAQAEPLLLNGYQKMLERKAIIPAYLQFALADAKQRIVKLYDDWGKPDKANEWQKKI